MHVSQIYDQLGGRDKTADLCGVSRWATFKWDRTGVPAKHWLLIADKLSVPMSEIAAAKAKKPKRKRVTQ
jgi:hypothetical protein